ncbi:zinc finger protein 91-like isoform X7 [Pectinophora gossypiella]|uniref:zinc finger protein 91-like isoform X7 n=1 Tax=Pectinophora gossypiella TaxID=13191 RepID=UPI00214E30C0|nr:zinc finger protein 91-like isoform X7 [Pectinophora gossypiella]
MTAKSSDWRPGPSVCRCCFAEGCYKDISTEYFWMGKREVYQEMLSTTFDVSISYAQSGGPNSNSRLICEPCIARLRDASDFKRQVQECERVFHQHLDPTSSVSELEAVVVEPPGKEVKLERVKVESKLSDDEDFDDHAFVDDDDDDLDDQPLTALATKVPKKESVDLMDLLDNAKPEKRKAAAKPKTPPAKKAKKKESPKPSASKPAPKPVEKKRKGDTTTQAEDKGLKGRTVTTSLNQLDDRVSRIKHATILLENSTICPFKWLKNLYMCFYCNEQFVDPADLREHSAMHSLNKDEIERMLLKMKRHELAKVEITNTRCKICNETLLDFKSLKSHLSEKHNKLLDLNSSSGVLPFKLSKSNFNCALCSKEFDEFTSLNHHMNVHFQNYICELCGAGFITPDRLRTHSYSHQTGSFPCDGCSKVFRSANARNEHYDTVHRKVQRHRCPHCVETFKNYYQRNKHISTVHGLKIKEFKCQTCLKVFQSSGKLGVHKRMVHEKLKRYQCDACEWKFYSKFELEAHMIRHGGERKYQCSICKKAYARKYTLRMHMRIHENDRRYVCAMCGGAFVQKCSLKHHIKVHHPNTFKCDQFENAS